MDINTTATATDTRAALLAERDDKTRRLVSDFDLSGWAPSYAARIKEIDAILKGDRS